MTDRWRRGRRAEWLAAWWLRLKGYRILARNHPGGRGTGLGEIDIVARRGGVVVFVEVKTRPDQDSAAHAIGSRQQRRIALAAARFVAHRPDLARCDLRFDAVLMAPGRWPRHILAAWRMDA